MINLIAFTQVDKLYDLNYNIDSIEPILKKGTLSTTTPFLVIKDDNAIIFTNSLLKIDNISTLLIYDYYNEQLLNTDPAYIEIQTIIDKYSTISNCLKIKHTNMHILLSTLLSDKTEWVLGYHIAENNAYKTVIDSILGNQKESNKLVEEYLQLKLRAKLQLLHDIHDGEEKIVPDESIRLDVKDALDSFKKDVSLPYKNNNEDHRIALIILRDTILSDI